MFHWQGLAYISFNHQTPFRIAIEVWWLVSGGIFVDYCTTRARETKSSIKHRGIAWLQEGARETRNLPYCPSHCLVITVWHNYHLINQRSSHYTSYIITALAQSPYSLQ